MTKYEVQDESGNWHEVSPMQAASYKAAGYNVRTIG